jgi:branched-chain amino acid transport system ATP-binding protein
MLKVENISTGYGKKQVLYDISLEVKKGEIVLLAGSNGSGKSTLLKAIYGLLPPWNVIASGAKHSEVTGKIIFNGEDITTLLQKGLLYIPQEDNLFEDLTVRENLEMAGLTLDRGVLKQRMENALSIFSSLVPLIGKIPMKLSGGERRLITLAIAYLHTPKMILIDEPLAGLTPRNIALLAEHIKLLSAKNETTLIIVEQRVKECLRIADNIIALKLGEVFGKFKVTDNMDLNELNLVFV